MTNPISGTTGSGSNADLGSIVKDDALGRDVFLQLLITQLQNQDPMQPQENGEFIAQLAQFSSLENLTQIKDDIAALRSLMQAISDVAPATTAP